MEKKANEEKEVDSATELKRQTRGAIIIAAATVTLIATAMYIYQSDYPFRQYIETIRDYKYQYQKNTFLHGSQEDPQKDNPSRQKTKKIQKEDNTNLEQQYQEGLNKLQHLSFREKYNIIDCTPITYSSKKELLFQIEKPKERSADMITKISNAYERVALNPSLKICTTETPQKINAPYTTTEKTRIYIARELAIPNKNIYIKEERIK